MARWILLLLLSVAIGCGGETTSTAPKTPKAPLKPKTVKSKTEALKKPTVASAPVARVSMEAEAYTYTTGGRRDPFRSLIVIETVGKKSKGGTPLQQRGLGEIKLVGIVSEKTGYAAMVETPEGKGYTLRVGTRVGPGGGKVIRISDKSIVVEEVFGDIAGEKKTKETVIELHTKEEELE